MSEFGQKVYKVLLWMAILFFLFFYIYRSFAGTYAEIYTEYQEASNVKKAELLQNIADFFDAEAVEDYIRSTQIE